ncbi:MAG: MFS transporter [Isosphaeraceae bacterium]
MNDPSLDAGPMPHPSGVRFLVLLALAFAAILSYLLRTCLAVANTTVQGDLGLTDVSMGFALAGFYFGYTWFQIPAGLVGDRFGARRSLAVMGALWACFMLMTATARSFSVLQASQVAQGVAQAGLFAVTIKALAVWFPASRRGMTSAVITACMSVGAVVATSLTGRLIVPVGWRVTFLLYAVAAAAWALVFYAWFRDRPEQHGSVNPSELALIQAGQATKPKHFVRAGSTLAALIGMATSLSMWALCVQAFFRAFGYALWVTWFPAYLEKAHGLSIQRAGELTSWPLIGVVIGAFVGGWIVDAILVRTGSRRLSRSVVAACALGTCGLLTFASAYVQNPYIVVGILSLGALISAFAGPTTWAATMDLCPEHSAVGFAVMNMAGNFGAMVCPVVVGYQFDLIQKTHGGWEAVLYLFAGVYLAGAVAWLFLNPNRPASSLENLQVDHLT